MQIHPVPFTVLSRELITAERRREEGKKTSKKAFQEDCGERRDGRSPNLNCVTT